MALEVRANTNYHIPEEIPRVCFRCYDIRGLVASDCLTPNLAYAIGLAVGTEALLLSEKTVIVGRDGRLSGPELCDALIAGLLASGIGVVFIGIVATPVLYFATHHLSSRSGVMVTASHNPANHNGFKIVLAGKTLSEQALQKLYQRICQKDFRYGKGKPRAQNLALNYVNYILKRIHLQRKLKVVLDCGNGAAAVVAPTLFEELGCDVVCLYCELDGRFPNHHPDPTIPENLQDLIAKVKAVNADVGLAFDGDADRLGVVTNSGQIIWPDRQIMLFAIDVLRCFPNEHIVFDVKCSRDLAQVITSHGGKPVMWRSGHSIIKAKAFECDAPLAGEMSGHLFFRDRWFGFDDGMYVGARLLEILSRTEQTADELFNALPNSVSTPELKIVIPETEKASFMQRFIAENDFSGAELVTIDGVRMEYADGWALIRPSNTSACLTLRFEAVSQSALENLQTRVKMQVKNINPQLKFDW